MMTLRVISFLLIISLNFLLISGQLTDNWYETVNELDKYSRTLNCSPEPFINFTGKYWILANKTILCEIYFLFFFFLSNLCFIILVHAVVIHNQF